MENKCQAFSNYRLLLILLFNLFYYIPIAQTIQGSFESKFKRYQKNESFSGAQSQNWNTIAWKGDRIHKQILLWSNSNVNVLSYNISNLTNGGNQIAASNIKLRFGKYIKGDPDPKTCSSYPTHPTSIEVIDALSDETITSLLSTDPLKLWITIDVPTTTIAGVYEGTITVNGGISPIMFNIKVNVVNYTLPSVDNWSFHLDLWQFPVRILNHYNNANPSNTIALWSDEHFALFEPGYRLLANMGQKAITAHIKENALGMPTMIKWIKKIDGTWEYDFTAFDKYVTALMSWGIDKQINCFSPVGWNETVIPYWNEATNSQINLSAILGSTAYNTRWNHFLTAFKTHLDSKGWFNKAVLYLDEVEQSKLNNVLDVIQNNNSTWKIGIAHTSTLSGANSSKLYDASGILGTTSTIGRSGKITTFYTSCTQVAPNSYVTPKTSLAEMTWMGWHASKEGLNGYLRWAYDNWSLSDPFDARDGAHTAGDFAMVYRNSNNNPTKYLPSLRLILLREGIQDFEKLKILKTTLENASDDYSQQLLDDFNNKISSFDSNSGINADVLVKEGQKMINELTLGTFSYCKVNGGADSNYYLKTLSTTGGITNLNFSTSQYPNTGYEYHTGTKLSVLPGGSFSFALQNSSASNCARTTIWIDWNDDEDFDDLDELVFTEGTANSCNNILNYNIPVTVPYNSFWGEKRIRNQVKKSDLGEPTSCGIIDKTGTTDFILEVLDPFCTVTGTGSYNVAGVTTSGGTKNINLIGAGFGTNNYVSISQILKIDKGSTFNLSVTNGNGWSRSIVWIDWNGDNDFDDLGERLQPLSPEKVSDATITYNMDINVPLDAIVGFFKMRIVSGDAWTYEDSKIPNTPCGIPTSDGTLENSAIKDFVIDTTTGSLSLNNIDTEGSMKIFPNPLKKNKLTVSLAKIKGEQVNFVLYNISGQAVYKANYNSFNSSESMFLSKGLANGLYIMKTTLQSGTRYSKIMIAR